MSSNENFKKLEEKKCTKCGLKKPLTEFYKQKTNHNGFHSWCKDCFNGNAKNRKKIYDKKRRPPRNEKEIQYRLENKDRIAQYHKSYTQRKFKEDITFRVKATLRSRIISAIKNQYGSKAYKSMDLIGCSVQNLRIYLESQFEEGMTWDNHGLHGWHIDHIKPCASFNLLDPKQQKECFHYTNLQPLWADHNRSKGSKVCQH
jgi:hypothetical protein